MAFGAFEYLEDLSLAALFEVIISHGYCTLEGVLIIFKNSRLFFRLGLFNCIFIIFENVGIHISYHGNSQKIINQFLSRKFYNKYKHTWKLFLSSCPHLSLFLSIPSSVVGKAVHQSWQLTLGHESMFTLWVISMEYLDELLRLDFSWKDAFFITVLTNLKDLVLDLSNIIHLRLWLFTDVATQSISMFQLNTFIVLSGRKVNDSPVFEKTVNSNNYTDITNKCSPTVCSWEMFLDIFKPHTDHGVAIVFVQLGITSSKGEWKILLLFFKKLGKGILLDLVYVCQRKPSSKGRKGKMWRWLDNSTGYRHSILLHSEPRALRYKISWMSYQLRRYMVRMMRLTWKRPCPSLGVNL